MAETRYLMRSRFQTLLDRLRAEGYKCVGPQVRDGAILFRPLDSVDQLPRGVGDEQSPGRYRIEEGAGERYFAWANGPQAIKPTAFPSREVIWRVARNAEGRLAFGLAEEPVELTAFIGVRACDLAALAIHDQHFLQGTYPNPQYGKRRERQFIVAVNCSHPAATCFCASTGDGPGSRSGFDLALDELDDGFLVQSGTERGRRLMDRLELEPATEAQRQAADRQLKAAAESQSRSLPSRHLRDPLFSNLEHPRWREVAERCLSCGNCTSVCPTCFCHKETEEPALSGDGSEHFREWDSCFTANHSYIHGFVVRDETPKRYRQWLTHKLGSWHEQFGRAGCVGCGRCITWCPAGIDLTEEAWAICGEVES